jgi:hypothetical protein
LSPAKKNATSPSTPVVMPLLTGEGMGMTTGICTERAFFAGGLGAQRAPNREREGRSPLADFTLRERERHVASQNMRYTP